MKAPTKVRFYYNGKRKKDIYPEHSMYYRIKYNFQHFLKSYSILLMVLMVLGSGLYLQKMNEPRYCDLIVVTCE